MKKVIGALALVSLMAAGCGSSSPTTSTNNNSGDSMQQVTPTPMVSPTPTPSSMEQSGEAWEGTLMTSDNSVKGKYKIMVDGHSIYISTSRDYSSLVGKNVIVKHTGTTDNFSLIDIVAK